jgi:hypothetical protein
MTPKKLMTIYKLRIFAPSCMIIPIAVRYMHIHSFGSVDFRWKELRVFGFLVAMWGTMG